MNPYKFVFEYDNRGYGMLRLYVKGRFEKEWYSRSGSCDSTGKLVNSIPSALWNLQDPPVLTSEQGMVVNGFGWKERLYTEKGEYTHFLFHPDSGKPGTAGCVGLQNTDGRDLYVWLPKVFTDNPKLVIPVLTAKKGENPNLLKEDPVKKYSFLKGLAKSLLPTGLVALSAGGVDVADGGLDNLPTDAIVTVLTWVIMMVKNWLKNRK